MSKIRIYFNKFFKRILSILRKSWWFLRIPFEFAISKFIVPSFKFILRNLFPIVYFYYVFYAISIVKFVYINKIASLLTDSGYIKTYVLLNIKYPFLYSTGLAIILLLIMYKYLSFHRNVYKYSFKVFLGFCFIGLSILIFDEFELLSIIFIVLYGSLIATVFGLYKVEKKPQFIYRKDLTSEIKLELIKIRISNWWRGLSLLTNILIALFITALLSWVLNPPPENAKVLSDYTLKSSFILFTAALPGLIYIYIKILRQINFLEKCVLELGFKNDSILNSSNK